MIKVEYELPLGDERQQLPGILAQPAQRGDVIRSVSGALFKVKNVIHASRMIQSTAEANSWIETPVVILELM